MPQHLQRDLEIFLKWCVDNELYLNVEKGNIMSFTRKRSTIEFEFMLLATSLKRARTVRYLGVLMDKKLTFLKRVDLSW